MKIIDILNKKAEKKLENEARFVFKNRVYEYNKKSDEIISPVNNRCLGDFYKVENILLDEIELIGNNWREE